MEALPRDLVESMSKIKFYIKISTRQNLAYFSDFTRKLRCKTCGKQDFILQTLPSVLLFINSAEERLRDVLPVLLYDGTAYGLYAIVATQFREHTLPRVFLYQANEQARTHDNCYLKYTNGTRKPVNTGFQAMQDILSGEVDTKSVVSYLFYVRVESVCHPYRGPVEASIRSLITPEADEKMRRLDGQDFELTRRRLDELGGKDNVEEYPAIALHQSLGASTLSGISGVPAGPGSPGSPGNPMILSGSGTFAPVPDNAQDNGQDDDIFVASASSSAGPQDAVAQDTGGDPALHSSVYISNATGNPVLLMQGPPADPAPQQGGYTAVTLTDDVLLTTIARLQETQTQSVPSSVALGTVEAPAPSASPVSLMSPTVPPPPNSYPPVYGAVTPYPRKKFEIVRQGGTKVVAMRGKQGETTMPLWVFILLIVLAVLFLLLLILVIVFGVLWGKAKDSQGEAPAPAP